MWVGALSWWSWQSSVAHNCGLLNHLNSFVKECSSLMQNLMQIRCSTHSVILNMMTTQYTHSLNAVYLPHWLVQWSHHCSHMCIPVHSPWLPGYTDVTQTILIILTMTDLFLDRPHIFKSYIFTKYIKYILYLFIYNYIYDCDCCKYSNGVKHCLRFYHSLLQKFLPILPQLAI